MSAMTRPSFYDLDSSVSSLPTASARTITSPVFHHPVSKCNTDFKKAPSFVPPHLPYFNFFRFKVMKTKYFLPRNVFAVQLNKQ